jgi:hypothetical protein
MDSFLKVVYENGGDEKSISLLGVSADTIFTVLTSLFVFIIGYIINLRIERHKEKKRLRELKEYFLTLIKLLEGPLNRQSHGLIDLSKQLKNSKDISLSFGIVAGFKVDLVKSINAEDLYKIFIAEHKDIPAQTQRFQTFLDSIEYIAEVRKTIIEFDKIPLKIEKYSTVYNENLKAINSTIDEMIINHTVKKFTNADDPYLTDIVDLRLAWISIDNYRDRNISLKYFVEPLLQFFRGKANDVRSAIFLKHLLECVMAYQNIEHVKYVWEADVTSYAQEIQAHLSKIKSATSKI